MTTSAPTAEVPQHLRALEEANRVRLARAAKKRKIRTGEVAIADVLTDPDFRGAKIDEVLMAQHRWRRARTRRLLVRLGITENRPCGLLTERQRLALLAELEPV